MLRSLPDDAAPATAAAAVQARTDGLLAATADAGDRACRAGCDACCHFPVGVTFAEAEALVAAIRGAPDGEALQRALQADAAHTRDLGWRDLGRALLPCPLLRNRRCALHRVRPLGCRSWHSRSAVACDAALLAGRAGQPLPSIPHDDEALLLGLGAAAALGDWPGEAAPGGHRELRSALIGMLAATDASGRTRAFRTARPVDPEEP